MSLAELSASDIALLLASDWSEPATVAGVSVQGVFETDTGAVDEVENPIPSLLVPGTVAAAVGDVVECGGKTYAVIRVEKPWRDVKRLYLTTDTGFAI